jgi:hypothetical protein
VGNPDDTEAGLPGPGGLFIDGFSQPLSQLRRLKLSAMNNPPDTALRAVEPLGDDRPHSNGFYFKSVRGSRPATAATSHTGRSRGSGASVRDSGGWRDHLHPLSLHGIGSLANRDRARGWRPGWCLHRCLRTAGLPDALIGRLAGILVIAIGVRNL